MERSAELTPEPHTRARRLADAAELAVQAGHFTELHELGRRVHELTDDPAIRVRVDYVICYALAHTTRQRSARLALLELLERSRQHDVTVGWETLTSLAALALRTGEGNDDVRDWEGRLEAVDRPVPWPFGEVVDAARHWVRAVAGSGARTPALVGGGAGRTRAGRRRPGRGAVFNVEMLLGSTAWVIGEHDVAHRRLARAAELMLRADAPGELAQTLLALGLVRFEIGRWDEADETSRLLADVAEARGLDFLGYAAAELRARTAAVRGDVVGPRDRPDHRGRRRPRGVGIPHL